MQTSYVLTEATPSTTSYIRSGRGGAGNTFRTSTSSSSSNKSSSTTTSSSSSKKPSASSGRFFSGIGGAGNVHPASQRPAVSLEEEFRRAAAVEERASRMGHCGIGGAGNVYRRKASYASDKSCESVSSGSSSTTSKSSRSKLWAKVKGNF